MDIVEGGLDGAVAQQELNGAGINARVKQVRPETVSALIATLHILRRYFRFVTPTIPSSASGLNSSADSAVRLRTV